MDDVRERCRILTRPDGAIVAFRCCACAEVVKLAERCKCDHRCCVVPRDAASVRFVERAEELAGAYEAGAAIAGFVVNLLRPRLEGEKVRARGRDRARQQLTAAGRVKRVRS